ncbi:MAG TPA: DNA glycosylase [Nitrososphaerales archaeon]|nr:DNA glycosylase [Nitrososphaerales archaeon]
MEFTIPLDVPFNLDYTLDSGQVFRWRRKGEWWCGVVAGGALKVRQEAETLRCVTSSDLIDSSFVSSYFRLDEDLEGLLATITKDETVTDAVERFYGLRLIRQERWECLGSFVLATNANIPRIQKMVSEVCAKYGRAFEFEGDAYYAFPAAGDIAEAPIADLRAIGLGYRAAFLKRVASSVARGDVDFERVASLPYEESRRLLLSEIFGEKILLGVGPKVADCVLLYSFGKDEAFPIDVWIARVLSKSYPRLLSSVLRSRLRRDGKAKLSQGDYSRVSASVRKYFGKYAGYAQQYLFMAAREPGA